MTQSNDIIEKIYNKYYLDAAGFTTRFTNCFVDTLTGEKQRPYPKQVYFMNQIKPSKKVVVVYKARQSGFTTSIKAKAIHKAYFKKTPQILISSTGINASSKVLRDIKSYFNSMPEFMRPSFRKETETILILDNGVEIYSLPTNPDTMRGFSADVICDEFAMLNEKDSDEVWAALAPSITKEGRYLTVVSTPKGSKNFFFKLCFPFKSPETGELITLADEVIKVHWSDVPFIAEQIDVIRSRFLAKQFEQEYDLSFLESESFSLFSYSFMQEKAIDQRENPINFFDLEILLQFVNDNSIPDDLIQRQLREEYPRGIYVGWDASTTTSQDDSVVTVFGVTKDEIWEMIGFHIFDKNTPVTTQVSFVDKVNQMFQAKKCTYDGTSAFGITVGQLLKTTKTRSVMYPFMFTNQSKQTSYSELKVKMEQEGFRIPPKGSEQIVKQFTTLGYNPVNGRIAAIARTDKDDVPSSFICAYNGRKRASESGFSLVSIK